MCLCAFLWLILLCLLWTLNRLIHERQGQCELAATSGCALDFDIATMRARYVTHERQSEPAALRVMHERIARSIELLKDPRLLVSIDTNTTIAHLEFEHTLLAIKPDAQKFFVVG